MVSGLKRISGLLALLVLSGCQQAPVAPVVLKREPVVALVLGGGGAKGFAHIGVIKVLESHGIRPQLVVGTSAGSFVGGLYASGLSPFALQQLALGLEESDVRDLTLSRQGFLLGQKLQDYINAQVKQQPIQNFPLRFAAVATEADTGRKVVFSRGNAGQAIRASCSIPNVFVPVTIAGKEYVDGGLVSPIPVETARDLGADVVIAVDISARPMAGQTRSAWALLDQTINIMGQQAINRELLLADVVIKPQVLGVGTLALESKHQSLLEGERAAQAKLALIVAAIAKKRSELNAPALLAK
ncbi:MAG: patatin-like phospholipase family protein [Pseudomonadota bacterium]